MTFMFGDVHSTFWTRKSLIGRNSYVETKSFSRNLHGPKPRSCKYCSLGLKPGHWCHHNTISFVFDDWFTAICHQVSDEVTCHSQPLLRLGSICECRCWNCCSCGCIWARIRNSSSRLPQVVCKLLKGVFFKICRICYGLDPFKLHLDHGCMWDPHLVWAFKESCGWCCSSYHDYLTST